MKRFKAFFNNGKKSRRRRRKRWHWSWSKASIVAAQVLAGLRVKKMDKRTSRP